MNRILPNNTARKVNNALPTAVANVTNNAVNGVVNAFNVANNTLKNSAKEAAAVMENAPAAMNDALLGVPEAVGNAVTNAANKMTNFASNAAKSVGNVVGNAATSVGNAANSVLNSVGLGNNNRGNNGNNSRSNRSNSNTANNSGSNKGFFNSFKSNSVSNSVNSLLGNSATSAGEGSFFASAWFIALIVLLTIFGIFVFFFDQIMEMLPQSVRDGFNRLKEALGIPVEPAPPAPEPPAPEPPPPAPEEPGIIPGVPTPSYLPDSGAGEGAQPPSEAQTLVTDFEKIFEKQLPHKKEHKEVFNVKENRYKYEDAEPLCNALGAELATYEQVKEAYEHGADWCNYGWIKGQRAVYPTQPSTYEKLQKGPKEQRQACGKPGINGGYFDNPDLRFGVTCYGVKPPQKEHDKSLLPNGEANPFTPDALEYDKRVAEFKADSQNIGILPFGEGRWDEA